MLNFNADCCNNHEKTELGKEIKFINKEVNRVKTKLLHKKQQICNKKNKTAGNEVNAKNETFAAGQGVALKVQLHRQSTAVVRI